MKAVSRYLLKLTSALCWLSIFISGLAHSDSTYRVAWWNLWQYYAQFNKAPSPSAVTDVAISEIMSLVGGKQNLIKQSKYGDGSTEVVAAYSCHNRIISGDGNVIVCNSKQDILSANDYNLSLDVFRIDVEQKSMELVSKSSLGEVGNAASSLPSISRDGRLVAFQSDATNLIANDVNGMTDIFLKDMNVGGLVLISRDSAGKQGNGPSYHSCLSEGGRYIAFVSKADNLVGADTNRMGDIFVHDRKLGLTRRISVSNSGVEANGDNDWPSFSPDGKLIGFISSATNLMGQTNVDCDLNRVVVYDVQTERIIEPPQEFSVFYGSRMNIDTAFDKACTAN